MTMPSGLRTFVTGLVLALAAAAPGAAETRTASPPGAAVYFHGLRDGARVPRTFTVRIGLRGMGVAPAGTDQAETGHHHILVDAPPPAPGEPLPADFNHIHLGNGQTEAELTLAPGRHTLQLVLGDHRHVPHEPPVVSRRISITVY